MRPDNRHQRLVFWVVCAAALIIVSASSAAPARWYWSETYAEHQVVATVKLPCDAVFSKADCNLKNALAAKAEFERRKTACLNADQFQVERCLTTLANSQTAARVAYIDYIRNGLPIGRATCIGTGQPDKSGYRFARFRCTILVEDAKTTQNPVAKGRIDVTPIGKTKLRWLTI